MRDRARQWSSFSSTISSANLIGSWRGFFLGVGVVLERADARRLRLERFEEEAGVSTARGCGHGVSDGVLVPRRGVWIWPVVLSWSAGAVAGLGGFVRRGPPPSSGSFLEAMGS